MTAVVVAGACALALGATVPANATIAPRYKETITYYTDGTLTVEAGQRLYGDCSGPGWGTTTIWHTTQLNICGSPD